MAQTIIPSIRSNARSSTDAAVRRLRFAEHNESNAQSLVTFVDPTSAIAWISAAGVSELADESADDTILVDPVPNAVVAEGLKFTVKQRRRSIRWQPGRVSVSGARFEADEVKAIAAFTFYDAHLRRLEEFLPPVEATAPADIADAYLVSADPIKRKRFGEIMQGLAQQRLIFARLEPRLISPAAEMSINARRLFRQLCRRAATEDRLSAVTDRLEALEDLYEGAVDRMTDYRWYARGNLLELIIVGLLAVEVIQLFGDIVLRWTTGLMH